jgi:hypothetical protein
MMEQAVQVYAAVSFLVIGLSHLVRPAAWVAFFLDLGARGAPGAFLEGFLVLHFGAVIVAFHNVWEGPAVVLTLIGWAQMVKGAIRFLAPEVALKMMARLSPERAWEFQAAGVFSLVLSGFLFWVRYSG